MRRLSLVLAVAAVTVAGCKKVINTSDAEAKVKAWAERVVGPVDKVDCPKVERKKGVSFECKVDFKAGKSYQAKIDIIGDDGQFKADWPKMIIGADVLTDQIQKVVGPKVKDLKVDCGTGILEVPDDGYLCKASGNGGTGQIRATYDRATQRMAFEAVDDAPAAPTAGSGSAAQPGSDDGAADQGAAQGGDDKGGDDKGGDGKGGGDDDGAGGN